jgi:hypothetical protein
VSDQVPVWVKSSRQMMSAVTAAFFKTGRRQVGNSIQGGRPIPGPSPAGRLTDR